MSRLEQNGDVKNAALFLLAYDGEERAYYSWKYLNENSGCYDNVAVLSYVKKDQSTVVQNVLDSIKHAGGIVYDVPDEQDQFIACIKEIKFADMSSIIIDISSLRTMHIFLLLKYLKLIEIHSLRVINTIPFDYIFKDEPFTSYKSYTGDLVLEEIMGFGGVVDMSQEDALYIFMGFEGALSLKVVEDTTYKSLYLVNTIPSYYQKYKDISVINNYSLLNLKRNRILYAPADNPFEVYNILDNRIEEGDLVCIAPLSTKPISLGACLYALEHENVRVVYPFSNKYNNVKSHDVYISYVYNIEI